jgi:DNA-binding MarR family transcriptional regulator
MTRELVDEALRRHGLTPMEQELLAHLSTTPGLSTSSLARTLHVERQTADKALARLRTDGLVERAPSHADRRATQWHLTAAGTERFRATRDHLARLQATLLDDLPNTERTHFGTLLHRVADAVRFEEDRRLWAIIRSRW